MRLFNNRGLLIVFSVILSAAVFWGCGGGSSSGGGGDSAAVTYSVTYNGNGNTGGTVPVDSKKYIQGETATVYPSGTLVKTGYSLTGWSLSSTGGGITYTSGQSIVIGSHDIVLYAVWSTASAYTVTYNGNGNTGGSVPSDSTNYTAGQTATVLGNTGNLVKTGYVFNGWTVQSNGSGSVYAEGQTYTMGSSNVVMYAVWSSPGTADAAFKTGNNLNYYVNAIAVQSDGKILLGGSFTSYGLSTLRSGIMRLNADGSLDTNFTVGTGTTNSGTGTEYVYAIAVQSDGKILIGGSFAKYNGTVRGHIARLNTDGTLDTTFDPGTGTSGTIYSIAIQSDGKILIGGSFLKYNDDTARSYLTRINADGSLDSGFSSLSPNNAVEKIVIQSDGKILLAGDFTLYGTTTVGYFARLNTDGSIDTAFSTGTGFDGKAYALAVQPDGKILVGGKFSTYNGTSKVNIARLNSNGTVDTGFTAQAYNQVYDIAVGSDGKIVAVGAFSTFNTLTSFNRIARMNTNGTSDTTFVPMSVDANVMAVAIQSGKYILIGGQFGALNCRYFSRLLY
jgi:uncharacterized delta-60 repeat protein/uncharacterized repeat protein (TIGR02543 family)